MRYLSYVGWRGDRLRFRASRTTNSGALLLALVQSELRPLIGMLGFEGDVGASSTASPVCPALSTPEELRDFFRKCLPVVCYTEVVSLVKLAFDNISSRCMLSLQELHHLMQSDSKEWRHDAMFLDTGRFAQRISRLFARLRSIAPPHSTISLLCVDCVPVAKSAAVSLAALHSNAEEVDDDDTAAQLSGERQFAALASQFRDVFGLSVPTLRILLPLELVPWAFVSCVEHCLRLTVASVVSSESRHTPSELRACVSAAVDAGQMLVRSNFRVASIVYLPSTPHPPPPRYSFVVAFTSLGPLWLFQLELSMLCAQRCGQRSTHQLP